MKKVVFVLVSLLLVSYCWALESDPSNEVGFIKLSCPAGYTTFGLPFVFWDVPLGNVPTYGTESRKPSDIIGTQALQGSVAAADKVIMQGGGTAYRNTSGSWVGSLETDGGDPGLMTPGRAYWYQVTTTPPRTIVLAGQVDKDAGASLPPGVYTIPPRPIGVGYNTYSWRDSRVVPIDELGLQTAGFLGGTIASSDKVIEQGGGTAWLNASGVWQGMAQVTPGRAYWIQNLHTAWANPYDYAAVIGQPIIENPDTPEIQKVAPSAKAAVTKTKGVRE